MAYRDNTKVIHIGDRVIGGGNPILIQSMTNTRTEDVEATVAQIKRSLLSLQVLSLGCCKGNREATGNPSFYEAEISF